MTKDGNRIIQALSRVHKDREPAGRLDQAWGHSVMRRVRAEAEPGGGEPLEWFRWLGDLLPVACLLLLLSGGLLMTQSGGLAVADADTLGQGIYGLDY